MAQVDFSNAVLDVNPDMSSSSSSYPLTMTSYLNFDNTSTLFDSSGNPISSNQSKTIITNTPTKVSILYAGTFTVNGGTKFYMGYSTRRPWMVSNISFNSGDTYSFVVDIEVSGNT